MGIKANFNRQDLHKALMQRMERINDAIINRLKEVGEECVNKARELNTYIDQTGNLRSSIGYVVYVNGKPVRESDFEQVPSSKKGEKDGSKKGKDHAHRIASNYPTGFVLVVVAGMEYAVYVENGYDYITKKGKNVHSRPRDVLTSAELLAKELMPQKMKSIEKDIKKMK